MAENQYNVSAALTFLNRTFINTELSADEKAAADSLTSMSKSGGFGETLYNTLVNKVDSAANGAIPKPENSEKLVIGLVSGIGPNSAPEISRFANNISKLSPATSPETVKLIEDAFSGAGATSTNLTTAQLKRFNDLLELEGIEKAASLATTLNTFREKNGEAATTLLSSFGFASSSDITQLDATKVSEIIAKAETSKAQLDYLSGLTTEQITKLNDLITESAKLPETVKSQLGLGTNQANLETLKLIVQSSDTLKTNITALNEGLASEKYSETTIAQAAGLISAPGNSADKKAAMESLIAVTTPANLDKFYSAIESVTKLKTALQDNPELVAQVDAKILELTQGSKGTLAPQAIQTMAEKAAQFAKVADSVTTQLGDPVKKDATLTLLSAALNGKSTGAGLDGLTPEKIDTAVQATALLKQLYPEAKPEEIAKHLTALETLKTAAASNPALKSIVDNAVASTGNAELSDGAKIVARYAIENPTKFADALKKLTEGKDRKAATITQEQITEILKDTTSAEYLVKIIKNPDAVSQVIAAMEDPAIKAQLAKIGENLGDGADLAKLLKSPTAQNLINAIDKNPQYFNADTIALMTHVIKNLPDSILEKLKTGDFSKLGFMDQVQLAGIVSDPAVAEIIARNPDAMKGVMNIAKAASEGNTDLAKAIAEVEKNKMAEVYSKLQGWFGKPEDQWMNLLVTVASFVIASYYPDIAQNIAKAASPVELIAPLVPPQVQAMIEGKTTEEVIKKREEEQKLQDTAAAKTKETASVAATTAGAPPVAESITR